MLTDINFRRDGISKSTINGRNASVHTPQINRRYVSSYFVEMSGSGIDISWEFIDRSYINCYRHASHDDAESQILYCDSTSRRGWYGYAN